MDSIFYVILFLFAIWLLYKQFAPVKGLRNLPLEQFKNEYKRGKLIDVREPGEFSTGHISGAVNIPVGQIGYRLGEIPKDQPVYLYCRSGMRSKLAGKILSKNGYDQIAHLTGGITVWDGPTKR